MHLLCAFDSFSSTVEITFELARATVQWDSAINFTHACRERTHTHTHTHTCSTAWVVDESCLPAFTVTVMAPDLRASNLHSSHRHTVSLSLLSLYRLTFALTLLLFPLHTHTHTHTHTDLYFCLCEDPDWHEAFPFPHLTHHNSMLVSNMSIKTKS